jgi:RNA-splicing ligase RtcB
MVIKKGYAEHFEGTSKSQLNAKTKLKELVNNLYYQKRNSHGQSRKIFKKKMLKAEEKLSCNGKVWMMKEKLDEKEDKKIYCTLEKLAIAASSYCFSHWDTSLLKPKSNHPWNENSVVIQEKP